MQLFNGVKKSALGLGLLGFIFAGCTDNDAKVKGMCEAIEKGDAARIESLIDEDIAKYKTPGGKTLLGAALDADNIPLIEKLIKLGANVNQKTSSYMYHILRAESVKAAQLLIDNGADVMTVSPNYGTPVHWAVRRNNYELVEFFINKKVDLAVVRENDKDTALDMALKKRGAVKIAALLKKHNAPSCFSENFDFKLYDDLESAVRGRKEDKVKELLAKGAEFDYEIFDDAVKKENVAVVKLLLDKKNLVDRDILEEVYDNKGELGQLLLDNATDLNEVDSSLGLTLLHLGVVKNDLAGMKMFIDKGADPKVKVNNFGTMLDVLEYAKKRKRADIVAYLESL